MFKDREKLYQAYHAVLSMALTWALVLVINEYYILKVPIIISAFYSIVPAVLIYLFDMNRKNIVSYLLIVSILPIVALIFWITKTDPRVWFQNLTDWCMTYYGNEELYAARYAHFIIFAAAIAGAIIFYLLTRKLITKLILAAILTISMIVLSINKIDINKAVVAIGFFYILSNLVELFGILYSRKSGKQVKKEGILYLAPICLLLAIFAVVLPSKPEPIQWKAVKHMFINVKDQFDVWKTEWNYYFGNSASEFFVSLTGYTEESGNLNKGGKIIKDNKVAMKLSGLDKNKYVYLMGSVSDIYTGASWGKSRLDFIPGENEYRLDYVEMFFALSRLDQQVLENNSFIERRSLKVEYNNVKTKTFFYPLKMSWYEFFTNYRKLTVETPQINFMKARGRGTSYHMIFYEMNLEGKAFQEMLREADTFSYGNGDMQTISQAVVDYMKGKTLYQDNVEDLLLRQDYYEVLKKRADNIKVQYTGLPDTIPDRVYDLAKEITADYDTKYDKLKAIENYLRDNYTYSLEVQKLPEGEDFVDYFLFESKEGYCTYYATAMAVLGRCVGVPIRYVEGFLGKFDVHDEDFNYLVKNSQAHAWAEAYIEGIGWIPFEATTPFYDNRYTTWKEPLKPGTGSNTDASNNFNYPQQMQQQISLNEEDTVIVDKKNNEGIVSGVIIFLSIIVILLWVLVIYYYVLRYRYKKVFDKADYSKKMYMIFLRTLKQLKREGFDLGQQETILMLSERVKDRFIYNKVTFFVVAAIFMRYRYAGEEMTKEDFDMVNTYYTGLSNKEKEEESRFKVWMEEFLFLAKKNKY